MKINILSTLFAAYFLSNTVICSAQVNEGWKGIRPLRTSKAEVEAKLGPSKEKSCDLCEYSTENEEILIKYSTSRCTVGSAGWDVPSGTVLLINVTPKQRVKFSDLNLDSRSLLFYGGLRVNQTNGVMYKLDVFHPIDFDSIQWTRYVPSIRDGDLRCHGFFPYNPMGATYHIFETLSRVEDANGFLDNVKLQADHNPDAHTYVIAYSGEDFSGKKFYDFLSNMKKHAFEKRKLSKDRMTFVDGGRLKKFGVDVFMIKKDFPPPVPAGKRH